MISVSQPMASDHGRQSQTRGNSAGVESAEVSFTFRRLRKSGNNAPRSNATGPTKSARIAFAWTGDPSRLIC